ncbi:MAG TPA: hypothetical protein VFV92_06880 [Candidatus Bathyarchaeia archaeon]|nr:hypothetical protein [Candidatus Bathyarchaeia archaeon]
MNYQLDIVALFTACLSLYFIVRAKKTYFLDSGFFIGLATVGFIVYLLAATYTDYNDDPAMVFLNFSIVSIMALSIGFAAYLLHSGDPTTPGAIYEIKSFLARPPLQFLVFTGAIVSWTTAVLTIQPWTLNQTSSNGLSYYTYSPWFIVASAILVALVIILPVRSVYRQSKTVRLKTASTSMKIISLSWAIFGASLFLQTVAGPLLEYGQSIGFIIDGLVFVLISFALREPTILARIITSGEMVSEAVNSRSENDTIVLYNTESDRKRLVETFVKDGLATGRKIVCHVTSSEMPFYRAVLRSTDLAEKTQGEPGVTIQSIDAGLTNPLDAKLSHLPEARRELIDLDELGVDRCREIIETLSSNDPGTRGRIGRIWAVNVEAAQAGILDILTRIDPKSRIIDLANQQDAFASQLNVTHDAILGSRLLLEFEPTSKYEDVVQKFVREFQANVEPVAIFTSGGSPIYRQFSGQRNIRLFSFSTKTSTPVRLSDEQVLLPERDTSLLLDAVDKLLQTNDGRRVGIVFEVFTYLILSQGFEKAYGVISSLVEMSESALATVLVLVNYDALEPRVISGIRGLFQTQLRFGSTGLKVNRFEKEQKMNLPSIDEPDITTTQVSRRIGA